MMAFMSSVRTLIALCSMSLILGSCAATSDRSGSTIHADISAPDTTALRERADEYFFAGRDLDRRGMSVGALACYERAYEFQPTSQTLRDIVVERYIALGRTDEAATMILGNHKSTDSLSDSDKRLLTRCYAGVGRPLEAVDLMTGIKDPQPGDFGMLAYLQESTGNLAGAMAALTKYCAKVPADDDAARRLGILFIKLHKYDQAESVYVAIAGKHPDSANLIDIIANIKLLKSDTAGAESIYKTALVADSSDPVAHEFLGRLSILHGDARGALMHYRALLPQKTGDSTVIRRTVGMLSYFVSLPDSAKFYLSSAVDAAPDDAQSHMFLGFADQALGDTVAAERELRKAAEIDTANVEAWRVIVSLCMKQKRFAEAEAAAAVIAKIDSTKALSWGLLGFVRVQAHKYSEAIAPFRRSVSIDSTDGESWFQLGSACERYSHSASVGNR